MPAEPREQGHQKEDKQIKDLGHPQNPSGPDSAGRDRERDTGRPKTGGIDEPSGNIDGMDPTPFAEP
jgi:hypothetical protein